MKTLSSEHHPFRPIFDSSLRACDPQQLVSYS